MPHLRHFLIKISALPPSLLKELPNFVVYLSPYMPVSRVKIFRQMTDFQQLLISIKDRALRGEGASIDECIALAEGCDTDEKLDALCDAADEVRMANCGNHFDTCSIVNGRSGRCSENCKWCAQAAGHHTGCAEYSMVDTDEFNRLAAYNDAHGVHRYSIVCSGRKVGIADIRRYCDLYAQARRDTSMEFCASMGLLGRDQLQALYDGGVRRYHCNLETAASFFPTLCTSHTRADKLRTIALAREVGLEVCSGGIIGMGETMRQRLEMVEEAIEAGAVSVPVNLLNPIKGTPLEDTPLLDEREVILTLALMRLLAPTTVLRFAGGRARLSAEATSRMLRGGVNGAIVGDMLTTVGNGMKGDFEMFRALGFDTTPEADTK